jgi:hypothetical protein
LLALVLSPVLLQTSTPLSCSPPGDATLSALELEVLGQDQIAFDPAQRRYDAWLPATASTMTVRANSTDPAALVTYELTPANGSTETGDVGTGGGEVSFGLPPSGSLLKIWVKAPEGASRLYLIYMLVGCSDCDDGNECTTDTCDPGVEQCVHTPVADGTSCDVGGIDGICVSGTCDPSVFPCTEQGILDAIARGGGPHTFACSGPTTVATQAEIVIDNDVTLDGEGLLTVDGNDDHRLFTVPSGVTAELHRFTVTGGYGEHDGGGIRIHGTLTLTDSAVSGNTVTYLEDTEEPVIGLGGGIFNLGTLMLTNSTVSGNAVVIGEAGGIFNKGTLMLTNSTVSGNSGTGIYNAGSFVEPSASLTMTNSTVSGNSGAGIDNRSRGTLTVTNSTVSGNSGTGIYNGSNIGMLTVTNSLVDGHCAGSVPASNGYNIESPGDTCGFDPDGTDQVNVTEGELNLGPLQDNGGPTMTHALGDGSVAIDVIPEADCEVDTDQRGESRPGGTMCDVGAFEVQP